MKEGDYTKHWWYKVSTPDHQLVTAAFIIHTYTRQRNTCNRQTNTFITGFQISASARYVLKSLSDLDKLSKHLE